MRVSTANQEEEETIENQEIELLQRIEKDEVTLLSDCIYKDEGWSGSILERPALDRLRADSMDNKFEVLYFYDRGRLSRIFVHQEIVIRELEKLGIKCISLHDISGDTHEEKLMGGVMGLFHEYERLKITERMRIGKFRKVKENKKLLGYNPLYGYNYLPRIKKGENARDGSFVINEEESKVVIQIFEWAADGLSKYVIRDLLFEAGIMPRKRKSKKWSLGVIDRMLRDTTYIGEHYYNKSESVPTKNPRKDTRYRKTVKGSRVTRPKEEWLLVKVPKIINKDLFDKVQEQLARNKRTSKRNNSKNKYLVGGLIECPCGYSRTGDPANGSTYYRCTDRLNNAKGTRECFEKSINVPVLDNLVWSNVKDLLQQPQLVFEQAKKWQEGSSPLQIRIEALDQRLTKLDENEIRYAKMYGEGVMSEHIYKEHVADIQETRKRIHNEKTAINDEMMNKPKIPLNELVEGVIKLVEDLDFDNKKKLIQKLVKKVVATKQEVSVWGLIPIFATGNTNESDRNYEANDKTQCINNDNQSEVGLDVKHRNCGVAECRQVYPV